MNTPAVLFILSAQHCDPELQAEFGANIPACMVPIGPKRLLDLQMEMARKLIPNLKRTFVALPKSRFSPDEDKWPEDMQVVELDSVSMEHTFETLKGEFRKWFKLEPWVKSVFDPDEWIIHFINGDTLVTDKHAWQKPCIAYVQNPGTPFEMSKEFNVFHEMQPRPGPGLEYTGKGSFLFSHKAVEADPLYYGSYMQIVRDGTAKMILKEWWHDFGHAETYYRSKRSLMSSRAFNKVQLDSYTGYITKIGDDAKIKDEYDWYHALPESVAMYAPRVKKAEAEKCTSFMYELEYIPCPTLAELLVYGNHGSKFWAHIGEKLIDLLKTMSAEVPDDYIPYDGVFLAKMLKRAEKLNSPWRQHAEAMVEWLRPRVLDTHRPAVVHGDLCFSNILYDRRSDMLKIIDPRGYHIVDGVRGDQMYDLAKLLHSVGGCYDFAVADITPNDEHMNNCGFLSSRIFAYSNEIGIQDAELVCLTSLLFYSMLPLHAEDLKRVDRLLTIGNNLRMKWMELTHEEEKPVDGGTDG